MVKIGKRQRIRNALRRGKQKNPKELAGCYSKIKYNDYDSAKNAAEKLINAHPYKCKFCNKYHVGRNQ